MHSPEGNLPESAKHGDYCCCVIVVRFWELILSVEKTSVSAALLTLAFWLPPPCWLMVVPFTELALMVLFTLVVALEFTTAF